VWSVTSFTELRKDGLAVERHNRLHPTAGRQQSFVEQALGERSGPVVAATDYIRALPDGIRPFVQAPYTVLGTDGFGRSDYRKALRRFFEVDRHHVVVAALHALGRDEDAAAAIEKYGIDPDVEAPWLI
jgi:pyruvate dehydrogenase E1 component